MDPTVVKRDTRKSTLKQQECLLTTLPDHPIVSPDSLVNSLTCLLTRTAPAHSCTRFLICAQIMHNHPAYIHTAFRQVSHCLLPFPDYSESNYNSSHNPLTLERTSRLDKFSQPTHQLTPRDPPKRYGRQQEVSFQPRHTDDLRLSSSRLVLSAPHSHSQTTSLSPQ